MANSLPSMGASSSRNVLTSAPSWKTLSLHLHRGQPETFTRINVRKLIPLNVRWHKGGDGEAAGPIRLRAEANSVWSIKRGLWMGSVEASKRPISRPNHHPPKHPRATSIARKADCYEVPNRRALPKLEVTQISLKLYRNNLTTA